MRLISLAVAAATFTSLVLPFDRSVSRAAEGFSTGLEAALNAGDVDGLSALVAPEPLSALKDRLSRFSSEFPDATWRVTPMTPTADGRQTMEVSVQGQRQADGLTYRLEASQRLAVQMEAGRLLNQELLAEQSLLRSGTAALPITLDIPDAVLTGSRYDVDVIFDQPLGKAVVAGGLLSLTPDQVEQQISPNMSLEPMGGGGLFKTVQAPQRPGVQNWAAMLVHPDGVVTITKLVKVVSDKRDLPQ